MPTYTGINGFSVAGTAFSAAAGDALVFNNCTGTIIIDTCSFSGSAGVGIWFNNCSNAVVMVVNSVFATGLKGGMFALSGSQVQFIVEDNTCGGMTGRTIGRGQFFQAFLCTMPGSRIKRNRIITTLAEDAEDKISLNGSSGTQIAPIVVSQNWIIGRGPSMTAGGIAIGENNGSYAIVENNTLINPGAVALFVAGGVGNIIRNNRAISQGQAVQAGMYIEQYITSNVCTLNAITGNQLHWEDRSNSFYDPGTCTGSNIAGNDFAIDLTFLLSATPDVPNPALPPPPPITPTTPTTPPVTPTPPTPPVVTPGPVTGTTGSGVTVPLTGRPLEYDTTNRWASGMSASASSGIEVHVLDFSFGDSSPAPVYTAPSGKLITSVRINIDTPFDGIGAALQVGIAGTPGQLMASSQNDPTVASAYETSPNRQYGAATAVILTITPGTGASAGSGQVVLTIEA
jgi:hypothetical protein